MRNAGFILLKELDSSWESYNLLRKWVSRLFHHYNKNTDIHCQKALHTNQLSIEEFKDKIFFELRHDLVSSLCKILNDIRKHHFNTVTEKIQKEMSNMEIEAENTLNQESDLMQIEDEDESEIEEKIKILKNTLYLLTILLPEKSNERNMVFNQINESFIEHSKVFFKGKLSSKMNYDCKNYLHFAKNLRKMDKELFNRVFEDNESMAFIHKNLDDVFYHRVLRKYVHQLMNGEFGLVFLIKVGDYETLNMINDLYSKEKSEFEILIKTYKEFLTNLLNSEIEDFVKILDESQNDKEKKDMSEGPILIEKFMEIYKDHSKMIKECFNNHFDFRFNLKKSFQESMSSNLQEMLKKFSIPEMMANFALESLKNTEKIEGGEEEKLQVYFEILVSLLGCLEEKDKFLHSFSKLLSKRLLNGDFGGGFSGLYWDSYFIRCVKSQVFSL